MAAWLPWPFKEGRVTRASNWHRMTASLYLGLVAMSQQDSTWGNLVRVGLYVAAGGASMETCPVGFDQAILAS
jgi:hypothetical protein